MVSILNGVDRETVLGQKYWALHDLNVHDQCNTLNLWTAYINAQRNIPLGMNPFYTPSYSRISTEAQEWIDKKNAACWKQFNMLAKMYNKTLRLWKKASKKEEKGKDIEKELAVIDEAISQMKGISEFINTKIDEFFDLLEKENNKRLEEYKQKKEPVKKQTEQDS